MSSARAVFWGVVASLLAAAIWAFGSFVLHSWHASSSLASSGPASPHTSSVGGRDVSESKSIRWAYTTGGRVESSPAVAGGTVYIGSDDHKVYALNAATGQLRWSYTTGAAVWANPAVAGGIVYIGSFDRKVYALNAATGQLRWSHKTGPHS